MMNLTFTVSKLPHLEHCGDWHDKPLKWIAQANDPVFTQKFSTKKNAEDWVRCCRRAGSFKEAGNLYMAI